MRKLFKGFSIISAALAMLFPGSLLLRQSDPVEAQAVSATRLYLVLNDSILARAPAFQIWTGSANANLSLLSTVDSRHAGDVYTYYTDAAITNVMTLKNVGGSSINLYNISNSGCRSTWDKITFTTAVTNWNGAATYSTSVYTAPIVGEQYTVTLHNGGTVIGTQTAYENVTFSPTAGSVSGYRFQGWYTDTALTTPYTPRILTGAYDLYGKFVEIDVVGSYRIFIESTNAWWYNSTPRIDIEFWKDSGTHTTLTMVKETGNLHSVILPNCTFNFMKLYRKDPSTGSNWNVTGNIPMNNTEYNVSKLTGPLDTNYASSLTTTEFASSDPYLTSLQSGVPALGCSNFFAADSLMATYQGLANNEKTIIDALRITAGSESLTYQSVLSYYVGWKASQTPALPSFVMYLREGSNSLIFVLFIAFVGFFSAFAFFLRKKKAV